jgi:transcriptional antiterminator RfaH
MNSSLPKTTPLWRQDHWFAIHAKPRREHFAAANIGALDIETFLPRIKVTTLLGGVTRTIIKPLFPGYFIARFCPENTLESVKYSRGVLGVVSSGRFPIPVDDDVIEEIQGRAQKDGFIRIRPQTLAPGTRVAVQSGPFEGMMGTVERELDDRKRVVIFLESLLNARVLIQKEWVEVEAA